MSHARMRPAIGGRFATNPGIRNRPMAEYFIELARLNLQAAQNDVRRAEADRPGSTGNVHVSITRALLTLEHHYPAPALRDEEEE